MKFIVHTEFDMFTYKAVSAAVGVLVYAILAYKFPQFDLLVVCVIAFLTGSIVWYLLSFVLIKRNGLFIGFRYSKNRPGLASVTLSKRLKLLDYMEFELPAGVESHDQEFDDQILKRLEHFFARNLSRINEFEQIHFAGCTQKDAKQISKLITK